jgi:hypothetical protein
VFRCVVAGLVLWCAASHATAQQRADTAKAPQDSTLQVFLDCPGFMAGCDFDYVRTEITFVNWVRQREDAHVHVLVTSQETGGGGQEYTIAFIGLRQFAHTADTLHYLGARTSTSDETRTGVVRVLKLGLMRFVARTPLATQIEITYTAAAAAGALAHDPWNYWVFRISENGNYSAEASSNSLSLYNSLSANRTTAAWKMTFSAHYQYSESNYHVPVYDTLGNQTGTQTIGSITRSVGADGLVVKSLGPRWSAGARASAARSTRRNYRLLATLAPALEYDLWPYSESTRRRLALQYALGVALARYTDTTIYGKTRETLFNQTLSLSLSVTQPWGSANGSLEGATYLHDLTKRHLSFFGGGNVRIVKGLSVNLFGSVSLIHDQLNLSKELVGTNDVLLARRQLATNYSYFTFFGLSYSFGSNINNVVNPRFDRGGSFFFSN